jgi:hypothetical protein
MFLPFYFSAFLLVAAEGRAGELGFFVVADLEGRPATSDPPAATARQEL